ncbi:MAG: ABC transporter substrate-binding protein [Thermoplasmata archaeon]|nr:ABC transporter substrate-binding protein [Thermoplasmata archaeon]MCI4344514.1 ABC transporter substrate-binding protein [Thermoplasmata archaeon]
MGFHGLRSRRGLSSIAGVIVIVLVLALMGVTTYALTGGFSKVPPPICAPVSSPVCTASSNLHDVSVLLPYRSVQQGAQVPVTASVPSGESVSSYTFHFGDGNNSTTNGATVSHVYNVPGIYLIEVQGKVGPTVHDNLQGLVQIVVASSFVANTQGELPSISGSIVANSTSPAGQKGATAVLQPAQTVTLSAAYTSAPTNPLFLVNKPTFLLGTGLTGSNEVATNTSSTVTVSALIAGTYTVSFVGGATSGNLTVFQNFTWDVIVAAAAVHAGVVGQQHHTSPHPGTIIAYELVPGGAAGEDPAIDYETAGAEPIYNVYQSLITYNQSQVGPDPTNFVPMLATCVPGSAECQHLYGSTLVQGWNYTFVINPNSSFFDPNTQAHWGVWPTDVVFSLARTMGFSDLPCVSCNPGWIIAQSLLDPGNPSWSNLHSSFNNTPAPVFNSMTINETAGGVCPAAAMSPATGHGCVTFHVHGHGKNWPYFLELIADPLGGGIVPCGWFSAQAQGAGIPFWTVGNVSQSGDQPCGAPGSPGFGRVPANIPALGWDQWEQLGSGSFGPQLGHVQWNMVGSGPYYMAQYIVGVSFTLQANPAYSPNPFCTWTGCQPAAGSYAKTVDVTWETTATPGEQAASSGVSDFASIPSTDIALLLELVQQGKLQVVNAPTITIGFYPFNTNFYLGGAQKYTSNPISVPTDWFGYLGMRQLFSRAYPYTTIQNTINTRDGLVLGFNSGGAIPQFMGAYYPSNIPWPNTDPCTDAANVACPAYWWAQLHNNNGPYFDPEVLHCSAGNPCSLPMFGSTGSASNDQVMALWAASVNQITGGAVSVNPVDINFVDITINAAAGPGLNAMPVYSLGWAPDYPDPTDYVNPLYLPNSTYTYGNAVVQSLWQTGYATGCTHPTTDYMYYANTSFPQSCQGTAYKAMIYALGLASTALSGPSRVLLYDLAEKIAYQLALYTYTGQGNEVATSSTWIDSSSLNTNVTIGGGGDELFFNIQGNGVAA